MKEDFFKKRKVTVFFAVIALVGGVFFLRKSITGNIILSNPVQTTSLSAIGILLILCSIILGAYSVKKK
ncbi:MAG: hypothetical protein ABH804_02810 [archaeon]